MNRNETATRVLYSATIVADAAIITGLATTGFTLYATRCRSWRRYPWAGPPVA